MGLDAHWVKGTKKHKYLMPLNKKMRKKLLTLSKPYPKIVTEDINRDYYKKKLNDLESVIFKQ